MDQIQFSKAIEGYTLYAQARRLSIHTIADYHNTFHKFSNYLADDPPLVAITANDVRNFFASQHNLSKKTIRNYHTGLSALWTWAVRERIAEQNIVREVIPPKEEDRVIVPFSEQDVKAMLRMLDKSRSYTRQGKRECSNKLSTATRNRVIILLLLDTGLRATEICELRITDVDLQNRHLTVFGKGAKERMLPFSAQTGQAIWRYLATRKDAHMNESLISTSDGRPLGRDDLRRLIAAIGDRANVKGAHPHRFRHTFAINYLRNGGNAFTLQMMLGHSTMDMVKKYLALAQTDIEAAHRVASPVANWRL
jgi:integrase/recombinase XerD